MSRIAGAALAALLIGGALGAQNEQQRDGNELLQKCRAFERLADGETSISLIDASWCGGFLGGVLRTAQVMNLLQGRDCDLEPGVGGEQVVRVVVKYLRDHPKELHHSDAHLALQALDNVMSCEEQ